MQSPQKRRKAGSEGRCHARNASRSDAGVAVRVAARAGIERLKVCLRHVRIDATPAPPQPAPKLRGRVPRRYRAVRVEHAPGQGRRVYRHAIAANDSERRYPRWHRRGMRRPSDSAVPRCRRTLARLVPTLRHQFWKQLFTLFRHDRVFPLFGLERVDNPEKPQNKAADPYNEVHKSH